MMFLPLLLTVVVLQRPDAATEYKQPQLAAAHGQIGLTFGSRSTIWYAASPDGGRTLSQPVKVASTGSLALGRHRGPRLAIVPGALVISAVAGKEGVQPGDLVAWRSTDGGRTWERTGVINDVPDSAREGLHAMTADRNGNLTAVWLDLRAKGTRLYGSRSADGGRTWSKNELVYESPDGTICQCCHPSLATDAQGTVLTMWRNVIAGNRDLYIARSSAGRPFSEVQKIGTGSWPLNACPMDGGGLAAAPDGRILTAWRREGEIFLAQPGKQEQRIGSGKDVALAATAKGAFAVWTGKEGIEALAPGEAAAQPLGPAGGSPSIVALPDGSALAAWEEKGTILLRRLP